MKQGEIWGKIYIHLHDINIIEPTLIGNNSRNKKPFFEESIWKILNLADLSIHVNISSSISWDSPIKVWIS